MKKINLIRVGLILILSVAMASASFGKPPVKPPVPLPIPVVHTVQMHISVTLTPINDLVKASLASLPGVLNVVSIVEQDLFVVTYDLRFITAEQMRIALMDAFGIDVFIGLDVVVNLPVPPIVLPPKK